MSDCNSQITKRFRPHECPPGPQGPQGDTGPQGLVGPKGDKGDTPKLDLMLNGNNLSLVVNGVADTVTLPTANGTPPQVTAVSVTGFSDTWGNHVTTLGSFKTAKGIHPIDRVGVIEGTNWLVFGSSNFTKQTSINGVTCENW